MKRSRAAIGTAVLTSALTSIAMLGAAPATGVGTVSEPLASGLQGAFQLEVTDRQILVGQNLMSDPPMGVLTWVGEGGTTEPLWEKEMIEVAGMASRGDKVAFLTTKMDHDNPGAWLMLRGEDGSVEKVANLGKFEENKNPDGGVKYGVRGVTEKCVGKLPKYSKPYKGIVESHPYAIANAPGGGWYVADAAGNTVLKVNGKGGIKVVDVVRPKVVKITESRAQSMELPGCAVGGKAALESVPTDVEVAENGKLVVSSLPGGEAPGAFGTVLRINPDTSKSKVIAKGLVSPTNVAISDNGDVYVTELFRGRVAKLVGDGKTETVVEELDTPAAIEWFEGRLYASVGLFAEEGGSIVLIDPDGVVRE